MSAILYAVCIALLAAVVSGSAAPEKALVKHLLDTYEELGEEGRPVHHIADAVKVDVDFSLVKFLKLEKGFLTLHGWLKMQWNDPFLTWDPSKFDGAKQVAIDADDIWTPDVTIYNDFHQSSNVQEEIMDETTALILQDGTVLWIPRITYKIPCEADKVAGQWKCSLQGGSWVHSTDLIDIELDGDEDEDDDVNLDYYSPTAGIELVSHSAGSEDKEFTCCPGVKYTIFTYDFVVKKTEHCDSKHGSCE